MPVTLAGPADLTRDTWRRLVIEREAVVIDDAALAHVERMRALFVAHLESGATAYGISTGLGAMVGYDLGAEEQRLLPRNILIGRAGGIGAPFPASAVRGAMLIRLAQFLTGASAVTPALCQFMAARLNDGFVPVVPSEGMGMAGEIIPLSHLAQTFVGEGAVLREDGTHEPARDWLSRRGVAPYEPQLKEGLSLIGGVAIAPALALEHCAALRTTLALATLAAAASAEGLAASLEAWSGDVLRLRDDPGMRAIIAMLGEVLDGSAIVRQERQPPVSVRIVPQVHGHALASLQALEDAAFAEAAAVGDNPAFIAGAAGGGRLVHSGNFHAAALTGVVEAVALALAQVPLVAERRLHRLIDARFSGLPHQLAKRPGLDAGLVILHKAVLGLTATLRSLAIPPSLMHGESSFGQEDAMTMTLPALARLAEIGRLTRLVAIYDLYAALVAIDLRAAAPGAGVHAVHRVVREIVPAYDGDRSYGPEMERLLALVEAGALPLPAFA